MLGVPQRMADRLGGGQRRPAGKWRQRDVETGRAGFDRRQVGHPRLPGERSGVDVDGTLGPLAQPTHQRRSAPRTQQAGGIVDAERVEAQLGETLAHSDEAFDVVDRRLGVDDRTLGAAAGGVHRGDDALQVARVVERVVAPENVDARLGGDTDEGVDDVVAHLPVTDQRLAADDPQQRSVGADLFEAAQAFERVLGEEAQARLERGATEDVEGCEASAVEQRGDRKQVTVSEAAEQVGLLPVPERRLHQVECGHRPGHCK